MEVSYTKITKAFTVAGATAATGLPITGVIVVPDHYVTWSLPDTTTPEEVAALDSYMADFDFERVF